LVNAIKNKHMDANSNKQIFFLQKLEMFMSVSNVTKNKCYFTPADKNGSGKFTMNSITVYLTLNSLDYFMYNSQKVSNAIYIFNSTCCTANSYSFYFIIFKQVS